MRLIVSIGALLGAVILQISCGLKPAEQNRTPGYKEQKPVFHPVDSSHVYGTWRSYENSPGGTYQYVLEVRFSQDQVWVIKTCQFGFREITVEGRSNSLVDSEGTKVTLNGSIHVSQTTQNHTCALEYPFGLEFHLRDDKIYIRKMDLESETGLKKVSDPS